MHIAQTIQIKRQRAVISVQNIATLLGRKPLSVLRAIDAIPARCLRESMFIMRDDEIFISGDGILMLDMSKRHSLMMFKIMTALLAFDDAYQAEAWAEFHAGMPHKSIVKLCMFLVNIGANPLGLLVFRIACWFTGYAPRTD